MCFVLFFLLAQGFQTTTGFITRRQDPDNNAQVPGQCFSKNSLIYSVATIQCVFFVGQNFSRNRNLSYYRKFLRVKFLQVKFLQKHIFEIYLLTFIKHEVS